MMSTAARNFLRALPRGARCGAVRCGALVRFQSTFSLPDLVVTKSCARRILALSSEQSPKRLRVAVEGGGCSGFQYTFMLEDDTTSVDETDQFFERDGARIVVDSVSLDLVRGSTVDYVQEMIRSSFAIMNNPNSESACGCGSSFAL